MKGIEYFIEVDRLKEGLKRDEFNEAQIELVLEAFEEWTILYDEGMDSIAIDQWERDQWYRFNQSGLFEKDDENNKTDIIDWSQWETRHYITERWWLR